VLECLQVRTRLAALGPRVPGYLAGRRVRTHLQEQEHHERIDVNAVSVVAGHNAAAEQLEQLEVPG